MQASATGLWLKDRKFDLIFFHLSALAVMLFLIPYSIWGALSVFPIYNLYLVFFGLPHNYMTWSTVFTPGSRKSFNLEPIMISVIVCAIISFLIPLTAKTDLNNWILSLISYFSLWHAYRQHHGICKVYDSVQAKRFKDQSIFADRKAINLFFGLAANGVVVWAFTHPKIDYMLSSDESYRLIFPQLPYWLFQIYMGVTALVGIYGLKRCVFDRRKKGAFIPWPQLSLMGLALMTYAVPYLLMPIEHMPLAVAIATMYHNVQYFGFVWLFDKYHSEHLEAEKQTMALPQRLAHKGSWKTYFTLAVLYSFAVIAIYEITPRSFGLTMIYFLGFAHYVADGYVWRRGCNLFIGRFTDQLAGLTLTNPLNPATSFADRAAASPRVLAPSYQRRADLDL